MANRSSATTTGATATANQYNDLRLDAIGPWQDNRVMEDNNRIYFGTGSDASIRYDGTNLIITPDDVGSGVLSMDGDISFTSGHGFSGDVRVLNGNGLIIGNATQVTIGTHLSELQMLGTASADTIAAIGRWSADANPPKLQLVKSRNATIGSSTIVQDNDIVGGIDFIADDGNDFNTVAAEIFARVNGTPGANDMPAELVIGTTADGAASPTDAFSVNSTQDLVMLTDSSIHPTTDGQGSLGIQTTNQWGNVWADLVNGSDISMANGVRMLETELYGYGKGWAIGHSEKWEDGKSIWAAEPQDQSRYMNGEKPTFAVTDDFIEFNGMRLTKADIAALKALIA